MRYSAVFFLIALCLYSRVFADGDAHGASLAVSNTSETFTAEEAGFSFSMTRSESVYIVTMRAESAGWIALGFGQSRMMKGAEIIMAAVNETEPVLAHHYGAGFVSHKPIPGSQENPGVSLVSAEEKDGITSVTWQRPLGALGEYTHELVSGRTLPFLWAVGKTDSLQKKHQYRGHGEITLP